MTPEEIKDTLDAAREGLGWTVHEVQGGYIVQELGNRVLTSEELLLAVTDALVSGGAQGQGEGAVETGS